MPEVTSTLLNGRLLNASFSGQLGSIYRSRMERPDRLLAWFEYQEKDPVLFKQRYDTLIEEDKRKFQFLQMVFEGYKERPFAGVDGSDAGEVQATSVVNAFTVMSDLTTCVAQKHTNGLFVVGPGGIGKTWEIIRTLENLGMVSDRDFKKITGFSTPVALYNLLYQYRDKLVVLDDCDGIFKDLNGINILKSVLDTLPERIVSWNSTSNKAVVSEFKFTGQVIFISNMNRDEFRRDPNFRALLTRVLTVVIEATKEELVNLCISKIPYIASDLPLAQREEILQFLMENYTRIKDLSLRYIKHLVALRKSSTNWRALAMAIS